MEENNLVWNAITESAKKRFDFKSFSQLVLVTLS